MELAGDGGGKVPALARSLRGRHRVAQTLIGWVRLATSTPGVSMRVVDVNGGPGAMFLDGAQRLMAVWSLDVADGSIIAIRSVVNPDKLAHLGPVGDFRAVLLSGKMTDQACRSSSAWRHCPSAAITASMRGSSMAACSMVLR